MRYLSCYPTTLWEKYHQPAVRDLAWMFFAPALLQNTPQHQLDMTSSLERFYAITQWLDQLDQLPQDTLATLINRDAFKRLGLYCETLFEVIATHAPQHGAFNMQLLDRNIQIFKPNTKITLGELDFLLHESSNSSSNSSSNDDPSNNSSDNFSSNTSGNSSDKTDNGLNHTQTHSIHHVEMACKFYLLDNTPRLPFTRHGLDTITPAFIGPNRADRLDIKLNRLNNHQLPLAHSNITQQQLLAQGVIDQAISTPSKLFLKGQLFFYYQTSQPATPYLLINKHALWTHIGQHKHALQRSERSIKHSFEFNSGQSSSGQSKWQVLTKLNWLAGEKADKTRFDNALYADEITQLINDQATRDYTPPILLQQYVRLKAHPKNSDDGCVEGKFIKGHRLMIVGDNWPCFA